MAADSRDCEIDETRSAGHLVLEIIVATEFVPAFALDENRIEREESPERPERGERGGGGKTKFNLELALCRKAAHRPNSHYETSQKTGSA